MNLDTAVTPATPPVAAAAHAPAGRAVRARLVWRLAFGMVAVCAVVAGTSIYSLYRVAYGVQLADLRGAAQTLAGLMEAVARFDREHSAATHPQGSRGATLSQIAGGLVEPAGLRPSEELVIGERGDGTVRVMRRAGGGGIEFVTAVATTAGLAEPLLLALRGERGGGELHDYRGVPVLAGYAYVRGLDIGVVYKIDLAEVRAPYLRAAGWAALVALAASLLGAWGLAAVVLPLQSRAAVSERRLAALLAAAPVGVYETDAQGGCVMVNQRWCVLAGLPPGQAMGVGWMAALHPQDRDRVAQAWREFAAGRAPFALEYRFVRPDGAVSWVWGQASEVRDAAGGLSGYTGTVTEITQNKHAEERVRNALAEKEVLLKEIYHRVKNNLQVVASLLNLQGRGVADAGMKALLTDSANRVKSMALVHEQLYQGGDLSSIDFAAYLQQIALHLTEIYGDAAARAPLRIEAEPMLVGIETAVPLGLVVNELVTNTYKHAFPGGRRGRVLLQLRTAADGWLEVAVSDDGVGLPAGFQPGQGGSLGMQLVLSLAEQLGGTIEHGRNGDAGSRFTLRFAPEQAERQRLPA